MYPLINYPAIYTLSCSPDPEITSETVIDQLVKTICLKLVLRSGERYIEFRRQIKINSFSLGIEVQDRTPSVFLTNPNTNTQALLYYVILLGEVGFSSTLKEIGNNIIVEKLRHSGNFNMVATGL